MFGSWTHSPNRVAAEWFVANVWPRVRSEVPESRFQLLGPGDAPEAATLQDGVDATGRVTSLAHVLGSVRVAVVPIQIGIGTRVKFIESLASGAAVVSTAAGSEGFSADGCFIQVDEPESFARACIELLRDVDKASDLGRRGRRLAFNEFSWDEVIAPIRSFSETAKA
jgi:glycosyltransferase involved in cell wall biosynthesis